MSGTPLHLRSLITSFVIASASVASAAPTPTLKPITDESWKNVAGDKLSEKYVITKGDTLYDISKRLFGDAKYWPKIWALNNDTVSNPHLIFPGKQLIFIPGTGTSLPQLTVSDAGSTGGMLPDKLSDKPTGKLTKIRSEEWRNLAHQPWETYETQLPPDVDALGFDKSAKIHFGKSVLMELPAVAESEKRQILGEITGARSESTFLVLNDTVYIRAEQELQVGQTYALTDTPEKLKAGKSDRVGYSYAILGKVEIKGVRDGVFVGKIVSNRTPIARGALLMPPVPRVPEPQPIAGTASMQGVIMVDPNSSTTTVAQHKIVFVDRGADDGIKPGMVFRAYAHRDPGTDEKVTSSDFIVNADLIVLHVTERFSTALVLDSSVPVLMNSPVVLLTDVSDLKKSRDLHEKAPVLDEHEKELDELDRLDKGDGLGKEEEKELKQLEEWKGPAPEEGAPPPTAEPQPQPETQKAPDKGPEQEPEKNPGKDSELDSTLDELPPPPPAPGTAEPVPAAPPESKDAPKTPPPVAEPGAAEPLDELPPPPPPVD
ncbi:LysM peptidoglycan-binding domain-containing protein [Bdellovibrionota bacterium FG-2]